MSNIIRLLTVLLALLALNPSAPRAQSGDGLLVFAAASLTDALQDIGKLWEMKGESRIRFNFAASSTLARQIEQGAAANLFASADQQWMDWVQTRNLIVNDTRRALLGNRLVLVAPADKVPNVTIAPGMDLLAVLGPNGRLATGDPASVPVGLYARQALTKLGIWTAVEPRIARADNVRAALLLVERGEAPLGIVYATDAAAARGVRVVDVFPAELTEPITYPFAVTSAGNTRAAQRFLDFLASPEAKSAFNRRGFTTEYRPRSRHRRRRAATRMSPRCTASPPGRWIACSVQSTISASASRRVIFGSRLTPNSGWACRSIRRIARQITLRSTCQKPMNSWVT